MGSKCDTIPCELRKLNRWVTTNDVPPEYADNPKQPLSACSNYPASVNKSKTWCNFEEARYAVENGLRDWLGFVFHDDGYVGIDIDTGFGDDGLPTPEALAIIKACGSYTELSKSGRGFHIICKADLPFKGRNNGKGWEIYKDGRHFVLTGKVLKGYESIKDASSVVDELVAEKFQTPILESKTGTSGVIWKPSWDMPTSKRIRVEPHWPDVESGARHLCLVSFCGTWHSAGCSEEYLSKMAHEANRRYMKPPLPDSEVDQVVRSCAKYRRD